MTGLTGIYMCNLILNFIGIVFWAIFFKLHISEKKQYMQNNNKIMLSFVKPYFYILYKIC